jgi:putative ABC transport system ATP-binding protein
MSSDAMGEPFIAIHGLSHAFGEGPLRREVLHQVSTVFHAGEIAIITGPSGSGKTTFLTLVGALRSVQQGEIRIGDQFLHLMSPAALLEVRRRIGFVFQAHNLLEALTACENVQLGLATDRGETPASARARALETLARVGLADHAHKKPRGLSGGQKQRVAIARALVRRPDIILADEPTAALDSRTGREVVDLLQSLARQHGTTILLVTHDHRILDIADRIIRIEDGCLEETHLGLDRLCADIMSLMHQAPAYLSLAAPPAATRRSEMEAFEAALAVRHRDLGQRLAGVLQGRLRADLQQQAQALQQVLSLTAELQASLCDFVALLGTPEALAAGNPSRALFESLEFLLLTAADELTAQDPEALALLVQLTDNRGAAMADLRQRYFAASAALGEGARAFLFDVTASFARSAWLLHQIAGASLAYAQRRAERCGARD